MPEPSASEPAYHVEVRQFPNVARSFNLTRTQLDSRILAPWLAGRAVEIDDRKFSPDRAKLKIIEGPALRTDEIAIGRGWANAERAGQDATRRLLARTSTGPASGDANAPLEEFKERVLHASTGQRLELGGVVALAAQRSARSRASECLALAEQAVWELLHQRRAALFGPEGEPVPRERWEEVVLAWGTWATDGTSGPSLEAIPPLGA
ncbi:MAG: hypothetical protein M3Z06_02890 [Actinomycetota bacterium]|nr:hypothetical protein [Actinomycetota bacterium]